MTDSCPVSCIYWTTKEQLPALEYVMQNRVQVMCHFWLLWVVSLGGDVLCQSRFRINSPCSGTNAPPLSRPTRSASTWAS